MPERSKDWLAQTERDLEVAQSVLKDGFYEWGCFISQQAAEKAVKGLFQALHGEAWGHSISKLLGQLPEEHHPSECLMKAAKRLAILKQNWLDCLKVEKMISLKNLIIYWGNLYVLQDVKKKHRDWQKH